MTTPITTAKRRAEVSYQPNDKLIVTWTEIARDDYEVTCTAQELAQLIGCEVAELDERLRTYDHDLTNDLGQWNSPEAATLVDFQRENINIEREKQ